MNEINRKNEIKTEKAVPKSGAINATVVKLFENYFSRLMVISDVIDRYVDVSLKNEVNWLRMRAIITLITVGKGSMAPSKLARHLMRPAQNITVLLEGLARDGLIVKRRATKDRRGITVKVTNAGLSYVEQSLKRIASADKELRYCLEEDELAVIASVVRKAVRHFTRLYYDLRRDRSGDGSGRNFKAEHDRRTKKK